MTPVMIPDFIAELAAALAPSGFILRGGFDAGPEDGLPSLAGGRPAAAVLMVGNAGGAMWRAFAADPDVDRASADPLDDWTRARIAPIAAAFGAQAAFPFGGPPWLPFQRWAMRAEPVHPSPLGILIHPRYGLWHAYRAALIFAEAIEGLPRTTAAASPCATCMDRPCLTTCPVGAFGAAGYDIASCAAHVRSAAGGDCRDAGCRARRACPVGTAYAYPAAEGAFHIAAFLSRH